MRTTPTALTLAFVFLVACKTRSQNFGELSASDFMDGRQAVESYNPAMIVGLTEKGPKPYCAAIPVQVGTKAQEWLVTSRFCIEKYDQTFMDGNRKTGKIEPALKVAYFLKDENVRALKLKSPALEPVDIQEYYFLPDTDQGDSNSLKETPFDKNASEPSEEAEIIPESDSTGAVLDRPIHSPKFTGNRCASALAVLKVKSLPSRGQGFRPDFLPIADMDEQSLNPLREEPEFDVTDISKGSTEGDSVDYLQMVWKGPAYVDGTGVLRFGLSPFEIMHVAASNEVFAIRPVGESPKLLGFEIGLPLIGGFRREEKADFNYKEPKIHGMYLGQSKWTEPNLKGQFPTFLNLATCSSQIRQLILSHSAYDRPSAEE